MVTADDLEVAFLGRHELAQLKGAANETHIRSHMVETGRERACTKCLGAALASFRE
jgi:hypothetical protein